MNTTSNFQYQVGGSLAVGDSTYITREADKKLLDSLKEGKFCYILASRQVGKSSLILHSKDQLEAEDTTVKCVIISISEIVKSSEDNESKFYCSLADQVIEELEWLDSIDVAKWWYEHEHPSEQLMEWIETILLEKLKKLNQKIIIFFDEIDFLKNTSFGCESLFLVIDDCYKKRTSLDDKRLTFAVIGVASSQQLISPDKSDLFTRGQKIDLHNFDSRDLRSLQQGLRNKGITNPSRVIRIICEWTGGQPFLTQKICEIIVSLSDIPKNIGETFIEKLIKEKIIDNWENQDNPEHLKTIKKRIVEKGSTTHSLLTIYQSILSGDKVFCDKSEEQKMLLLSGLVKQDKRKLIVANEIYKHIFNRNWVKKELDTIPPFIDEFNNWLNNQKDPNYLLENNEKLLSSLRWGFNKILRPNESEFLKSSCELYDQRQHEVKSNPSLITLDDPKKNKSTRPKKTKVILGTASIITITIIWLGGYFSGGYIYRKETSVNQEQKLFSRGERRLFTNKDDLTLKQGIEAFQTGQYETAIQFFQQVVEGARSYPEAKIYLNNAKARRSAQENKSLASFKLAVVVPIDNDTVSAEEILRGVADAQTEFNDNGGIENRFLEIIIINDRNIPKQASNIALQLSDRNYQDILGIIIHKLSHLSPEQLAQYKRLKIPIISTTSTSISRDTKNLVVFSTVFSEEIVGQKLAERIKQEEFNKIVVISDSQSNSSNWLQQSFENHYQELGGVVVKKIDLSDRTLEPTEIIYLCVSKYQVNAIVLLPSTDTTSRAIAIARANKKLSSKQRLQLFGGDILYHPDTLINGGEAVEGLILAVPWFAQTQYAEQYQKSWGGKLSWRTAMGYDATQALIHTLSADTSQETVLKKLRAISLKKEQTSGIPLQFSSTGERKGKPIFVQVVKDAPAPTGIRYGFQLLD